MGLVGELLQFIEKGSSLDIRRVPDVHLQSASADAVTLADQMTHFLDAKAVDLPEFDTK
jgi:hypothetical protein